MSSTARSCANAPEFRYKGLCVFLTYKMSPILLGDCLIWLLEQVAVCWGGALGLPLPGSSAPTT